MSRAARPCRVLVVDDNESAAALVQEVLELAGFEVESVSRGEDAIRVVRGPTPPRVVISDISLPGVDGFDVAREVKARCPETAVLALTGRVLGADLRRLEQSSFDAHIAKPFDIDALVEVVREHCGRAEGCPPGQSI